ncbi:transposase [Streptomyces sp. NBC_00045]|uniref:transposase n=1 Tax=Streptomyces sp. NBC_00045 TaxID=2975625 RepID=UPI00387096C5
MGFCSGCEPAFQWRDLPERFGPSETEYERHRLWFADGTWERLLQQVQAEADAAGEIDWDISVTRPSSEPPSMRPAPALTRPPALAAKGAERPERQVETPWQSLVAGLVEVVQEVRAWATRAAGSPPSST